MTKLSLRLLGMLLSAAVAISADAQDYGPPPADECDVCDLGCPVYAPRFEATASLLFLQPGSGNLEYGTLVSPLPPLTPHWVNQSVEPGLSPAFNLSLRYRVPECGNDIQMTWTHLETDDTASFVGSPDQFAGSPYEIGPDANLYNIGRGDVRFEYDSINIDAGHHLSGGGLNQVRIFAGLQVARLGQNLSGFFESYDGLTSNGYATDSLFTGVGPRVGIKAQCLRGSFDFLGEFAGALLVGRMESRMDFNATTPSMPGLGITPPNLQSLTSPDATQVIPSIDTKLGAGYTFPTSNRGRLRIEGGYQAAVYIDAVNSYSITEVTTPSNTQSLAVFLRTQQHIQSNFTVHGPYMSASWEF
ncbi:MAG: Lpg1974 family pore-forming outer membrane protein [Pirellulales bacterium]